MKIWPEFEHREIDYNTYVMREWEWETSHEGIAYVLTLTCYTEYPPDLTLSVETADSFDELYAEELGSDAAAENQAAYILECLPQFLMELAL